MFDAAGSPKLSTNYAYDAAGNRIHEYIVEPTGTRGYAHAFDVAGRITSSSDSYGNKREYEYDARGNRLVEREYARSGLKTTANSTFNNCDELLQRIITATSGKTATENYTYDGEGRLTTKAVTGTLSPNLTTNYVWDVFSNLTQVSFSDSRPAVNYTYDGAHRRIKRECGGKVTLYVRDETTDNVIAELDGSGRLRAQYITGRTQDDLIAKQIYYDSTAWLRARTERIYYLDTSRPVRESLLLRSSGRSEEQFFEEFGTSFPRASLYDLPRFCGKEFDPQTGLYAVGVRDYDPQTGRFLSRDPHGTAVADLDYYPYTYCRNNPLRYTDPTGMTVKSQSEYIRYIDSLAHLRDIDQISEDMYYGKLIQATYEFQKFDPTHAKTFFDPNSMENILSSAQYIDVTRRTELRTEVAVFARQAVEVGISVAWEPADWALTFNRWRLGDYHWSDVAGMLPLISGTMWRTASRNVDNVADLTTPARRNHILHGDATGGGHLWPGNPGKTPFPQSWSGDRIINEISDVATDPHATRITQGGRTLVKGSRDGVDILVVIDNASGEIISGYPTNLPKNP